MAHPAAAGAAAPADARLLRHWRTLYALLLVLRALAVLLPGYVHADEFFQSPEILAGDVFGAEVNPPWEFDPAGTPARSIVPPALVSGLPFWLLQHGLAEEHRTGRVLLVAPRAVAALLSLGLDAALVRLCRAAGIDPRVPLLWLASSMVTLVLQTRPFSNSLEAVVLAYALVLALAPGPPARRWSAAARAAWFGTVAAAGVFVRVTFPAFALPVCAAFLWTASAPAMPKERAGSRVARMAALAAVATGAAATTAGAFAVVDSLYFGALAPADLLPLLALPWRQPAAALGLLRAVAARLVWTPLNNLLYNLQPENLGGHTLHPRWLHVAVNMPALYGPLFFLALGAARRLRPAALGADRAALPQWTAAAVCASSLLVLSLVPHQEPRFLVPLLLPLLVVVAPALAAGAGRRWWPWWIALNVLSTAGYGGLHQAGVVPSLLHIDACLRPDGAPGCAATALAWRPCDLPAGTAPCPLHIVYGHTYMPPHHLVERNRTTLAPPTRPDLAVQLHDVSGRGVPAMRAAVDRICAQTPAPRDAVRVLLVTGGSIAEAELAAAFDAQPLATFGPHVSTEHLAAYLAAPWDHRTWAVTVSQVPRPCGA